MSLGLMYELAYYWFDVVSSAAVLFINGAAPPPSRKLTDRPTVAPGELVDANPPLKYGRRLTAVPLYSPAARIPGTLIPTFGMVSTNCQPQISQTRFFGTHSFQ